MLGERLRKAREDKGLTQAYVAKVLNISASTVGMYEQGRRDPDTDTLKKFAELYGCSTDYLLGRTNVPSTPQTLVNRLINGKDLSPEELEEIEPIYEAANLRNIIFNQEITKKLPLLGIIRAGLPILADENFEGELEVPADVNADFVLEVKGDSMIGVGILEYDYVLCRKCQAPNSGEIVIAIHDVGVGYAEATLKFFFNNGHEAILKAANPNYADIKLTEEYRIVAKMVGLVRKDRPSYELYTNYLAIAGKEEWTQVIEYASNNGLTPVDIMYLASMHLRINQEFFRERKPVNPITDKKYTRKIRSSSNDDKPLPPQTYEQPRRKIRAANSENNNND